jgi:CheY-like chemotaxis protein
VLINLVGNAVKFTEQGAVALRISEGVREGLRHRLRFEVEDSGIGIPPEALARLFTAFEQGDGSMTRRYGGTGLGLAISRRLVQLMGGEIGVHSAPGEGSTFWFELEFCETGAPGPVPQVSAQAQGLRLRRDHGGKRILVVEDELFNREVARELLQEAGLAVDLAEDGEQALAMLPGGRYDLVLVRDGTRPVACASGSCAPADSFLRTSGDVSLDYALEHMRRSAPGFGPPADTFLKRIKG